MEWLRQAIEQTGICNVKGPTILRPYQRFMMMILKYMPLEVLYLALYGKVAIELRKKR